MNLALCYKNFAANANISHIGLGVSALNTAKVLKRHGVAVAAFAINSVVDLDVYLQAHPATTHVVISAAWLPVLDLGKLVIRYPGIEFAVNIHSNVGFLQADANGVTLLGKYVHLQKELLNFRVSGNSQEFVDWLTEVYSVEAEYLPNLYNLDSTVMQNRPLYNGGTIRIGAFGACRPLKNFLTAAAAACAIGKQLRVPVDFTMNGGRPDGGSSIERAIQSLIASQPNVTLKILNWAAWPDFLDVVEGLHLMMQLSYTESFNIVTADGIAKGVPSVVSSAIDWVPARWIAASDDALDVARVGRSLITDPHAIVDGVNALERYNQNGFYQWLGFLNGAPVATTTYLSAATTRAVR
jgi:hypothetical protein